MNTQVKIYPDPVLRRVADRVENINDSIKKLIATMFEVMKLEGGIGLAAPQIGVSKRVIVISVDEKGFERFALINPIIEFFSDRKSTMEEGCLSVPGIRADVKRPSKIVVSGVGRSGRQISLEAGGLLARVIQHEVDHLNGVLFIDRISEKEKKRISEDLNMLINRANSSVS